MAHTFGDPIHIGTVCGRCNARPATHHWTFDGGVMGGIHGSYSLWCLPCCHQERIGFARKSVAELTKMEAEMVEWGIPIESDVPPPDLAYLRGMFARIGLPIENRENEIGLHPEDNEHDPEGQTKLGPLRGQSWASATIHFGANGALSHIWINGD